MTRLDTMARFQEPDDEAKPVSTCESCYEDLYVGDTVHTVNGEIYCSNECVGRELSTEETLERG